MKKIVMSVMTLMCVTFAFAGNAKTNTTNYRELYNMTTNNFRLAECLELTGAQFEAFDEAYQTFCDDMRFAGYSKEEKREKRVKKAINRNLAYLRHVLNEDQYRKYLMILNATFNNRGIAMK